MDKINVITCIDGVLVDKFIQEHTDEIDSIQTFNYAQSGGKLLLQCNNNNIDWVDLNLSSDSYGEIKMGYSGHLSGLPIDKDMLSKMAKYEDAMLRMVSRSAYYCSNYFVLRRVYINQLRYWSSFIQEKKVNLFIGSLPHNIATYMPYCLCKELGIKTVIIKPFSILNNGYYYLSDIIIDDEDFVSKHFSAGAVRLQSIKYSELTEDYFKRYVVNGNNTEQHCLKKTYFLKYYTKSRIKGLIKVIQARRYYLILYKLKEIIKSRWGYFVNIIYLSNKYSVPRNDEKYLLYAMHYQPEATTLPLGGIYVDQLLAIELISKSLPNGVILYVKEHPNQKSSCGREAKFYKDILSFKNVRMVSKHVPSSTLVDGAVAVVSICGTILLEAICKGIPGIMLGNGLYGMAPGVYKVYDNDSAIEAICNVLKGDQKISEDSLRKYFEMLGEILIKDDDADALYREISTVLLRK